MISDRMFGYSISKAAQNIASKNTAPVYFHEFGYSGEYSIIDDIDEKSYSRGSGIYKTRLTISFIEYVLTRL